MKKEIVFIGENEPLRFILEKKEFVVTKVFKTYEEIILQDSDKNIIVVNNKEILKNNKNIDIPMIFCVNNHEEIMEVNKRCETDLFDYVIKPVNSNEIINRIEKLMKIERGFEEAERKNDKLVDMLREVNKINKKLIVKAQNLEDEISMDPIANVYNKKYTVKRLEEELARTVRYDRKFAVVTVDVENVKEVNELYGHIAGDETINKVAKILTESVRTSDIVGRIRGNSFLIILPEIVEKYTLTVIERIVENIAQTRIKEVKLDAYAGFAMIDSQFAKKYQKVDELMILLDKMIVFGKETGRRIIEYNDESSENVNKIREYVVKSDIEEKHNIILEELTKSKKFIEKLLPKKEEWSSKLDYNYLYYPFNFVGGDFFDFIEIDESKIAVLFCDVSGHGVSSALYITAIKYIFKSLTHKDNIVQPDKFMEAFNKSIIELAEQNIFVATTYGIINKIDNKFTYSYGGGTVPIKISRETGEIEKLADGGYIVGIFDEAEFETREVTFADGDILFFYSDGIYEFLIENNLMADDSGFFDVVKRSITEGVDENIVNRIYSMIQDKMDEKADFNDDITVLAIKMEKR